MTAFSVLYRRVNVWQNGRVCEELGSSLAPGHTPALRERESLQPAHRNAS